MIMPLSFEQLLAEFSGQSRATEQLLQAAEKALGVELPADYRSFLEKFNGGEGFIGKHYLILWKAEDLDKFNRDYQVDEYAPGFLMFGSSGGGDGFAFDTRSAPYRVMQVPFIGMSLDDAFFVSDSFTRLLERMVEIDGPLF
jgi:cell wall assembly regulator SMI1